MNFNSTHDCGDKEKTSAVGEKRRGGRQGEWFSSNQTGLKCTHTKDGSPRVLLPNVSLFFHDSCSS